MKKKGSPENLAGSLHVTWDQKHPVVENAGASTEESAAEARGRRGRHDSG